MVFDTVLAFDHVQHRILLIANARISPDEDLRSLYQFACAKIEFLERELERALSLKRPTAASRDAHAEHVARGYEAIVKRAKEHRRRRHLPGGAVERFEAEVSVDAFTVYRALRHVNPSPYMFFIRMGERSIVGASPEMLVRVEGGTPSRIRSPARRRGKTDEEDMRLAEELKREKERAEHVMLVDLGRNDIGRVCDYGTVRVPTFMALERYSHVMHMVSVVEGQLAEGAIGSMRWSRVSRPARCRARRRCAPCRSSTSSSRARAALRAGAVGYLDFAGNLDFCIAIRSILLEGGKAYIQSGGGIVADSNPTAEFEETRDKARAMIRALELAQAGCRNDGAGHR